MLIRTKSMPQQCDVLRIMYTLSMCIFFLLRARSMADKLDILPSSRPPPTYVIVAPNRIHPDQVVQVYMTILRLRYPVLHIRTVIQKDGEEVISAKETFNVPSSRTAQLKVPANAEMGNYTLLVEGSMDERMTSTLFSNHTNLIFSPKHISVFIFTDQHTYQKRSTVHFRFIAVKPDLKPMTSGSVDIYIKDGVGQIVRRWLSVHVNYGFYEGSFPTDHPVKRGWWAIEVHGWGQIYRKRLQLVNYFYLRHTQHIEVAPVVLNNEYAIAGTVKSYNVINAMPVKGNATVELIIQGKENPISLSQSLWMDGEFAFNFPLSQLSDIAGGRDNLADGGVQVSASVYDWQAMEETTYTAYTHILPSTYNLHFLGGHVRVFKPGQPFTVYIAVFSKDGSPLVSTFNKIIHVITLVRGQKGGSKTVESNLVVGEDSMVQYTYNTQMDDQFIVVKASYGRGQDTVHKELKAHRHQTRSGQYLSVTTSTRQPKLDTYMVFTVQSTTYIEVIHYQVLARGSLVLAGQLYMDHLQKTFSLALSKNMVPNARIIVWGILKSGEILADSVSFYVDGIRNNEMKIRINKGKDFSHDTVEINAFTDPGSFSAFSAEQEFLYRLGVRPFLTGHQVEEDLSSYDSHVNNSFQYTWWDGGHTPRTVHFPAPSYAIDANTTFIFSGLCIFTDAALTRIDAAEYCNVSRGYLPCFDGSCYKVSEHCDGTFQCEDGADELGCPDPTTEKTGPLDVYNKTDLQWKHLSIGRTWAWKHFYTRSYGRSDFQVKVPLWPDRWLVSGFSLDVEKGLSFTEIPAQLDTSRLFFILVEVPSRAVRGEQLGIQVAVHNKWDQAVDAILTLVDSNDYHFIRVEDFGIVSSYSPRTTRGDIQVMVTLRAMESQVVHFPILPLKIGKITATVTAYTLTNHQTVRKSIKICYDGVTNKWHTPLLLDLVSTGSSVVPLLQIPVAERFINPGSRNHLYVPGSGKSQLSIVGDIVGPGFFSSRLTIYNTLDIIEGSGDHYLYNFAVNLYWLKFLKVTNSLNEKILQNGLDSANRDLQTVYYFIHGDGSCDIRGKAGHGDIWFSAQVLEHLSEGAEPEWEHTLYVDVHILNRVASWLITQQNSTTGSFHSSSFEHTLYDIKIRSNMTDENGLQLNISVTAYATIALFKSYPHLSGLTQTEASAAIKRASDYLANYVDKLTDVFDICLVAYALQITKHNFRGVAFARMTSIRRKDNFVYWSPEPIEPNPVEFINTLPYQHPRRTSPPYHAKSVQATAYALMVYLRNNYLSQAKPIMEWLQTQRDHVAGFGATHDSLAALMALIEYAERETNRDLFNIRVTMRASSTSDWVKQISLNVSNYLQESQVPIPKAWGSIETHVQGSGLALYQMTTSVNVEYSWQMRQPRVRAFDLEVENLVFRGMNHSHMEMTVCMRWVATHISPVSGTAILEVDIPTGFYVRKHELRKYQKMQGQIVSSQRSRFTKNRVVMYFDYVDTNRNCFYFPAERWYPVANATIQHLIKVYDSNEPALHNATMYTTFTLFHQHICQVCGSFQCPYCPYYNSAPLSTLANQLLIIIFTLYYYFAL